MQAYIVSAIKYRPKDFKDVVGQKAVTETLERAIKNNRLAHAFLFCGPKGVGKTTCARILARNVNILYHKKEILENNFNVFELDAASNNSVDDIRNLIDQLRFPPQQGKYKVYIIDEVHMLSQAAFNAFLKTLEEPPEHAIFILSTTEKHKILPTILSRCQIYDFRRISLENIYKKLKQIASLEGIKTDIESLYMIAQHADGSLRDALSIFDRLISFSGKQLTTTLIRDQLGILDQEYYFKSVDFMLSNNITGILLLFHEILQNGFDEKFFIEGLAQHFKYLILAKNSDGLSLMEVVESLKEKYIQQASIVSKDFLIEAIQICHLAYIDSKLSRNPRLSIEISLIKLSSLKDTNNPCADN
ncbi:MAG: DNA polymerase III subunit gamma/tau [Candidatus Walczuchella monophlebidarum]